jgi:hypothetical protein
VAIAYDRQRRLRTLRERGLDFEDAALVFAGPTLQAEDLHKDYGEMRLICFGYLEGRLVVIGYVPRGGDQHIFGMRKANGREKRRIAPRLEV